MQILRKEKLENTLTQNWTKFIDYKVLLDFAINSIKLYARNWTVVQSQINFTGNKVTVQSSKLDNLGLTFNVSYEIKIDAAVAIGYMILYIDYAGSGTIKQIEGNLFELNYI
jgi:hypothetical protein